MPDTPDDKTVSEGAVKTSFSSIGPYRLIQLLGTGGMGEVWRAGQTEPFHRTVALKLIKAGMDTKAVVARFDSERQALALMEHPNIAKVYDAGATPAGRPYFVMEYVPGIPITDYCDKHRLAIKERLELFMQVCEGVQHAHQKAIIHRDLKPSNVLVEEFDQKPVPKIIDFGLAKATAQRLTEMTMFTEVGAMVGTPAYMSPEQADSNERNIDTRTDVYALGVILYDLLVGTLPFGSQELREAGMEAMLQKIRQEEPTRPSTKIKSLGDSSKDAAAKRREDPQTLERHLRGELDWITMKALEKDRARRYGSPSELAADIQRHMRDQPVLAGPPSARYRASKFIRRHRFGVGVAIAGVILLLAFATTMALQARRIARERDRANRITDFIVGMFKVSDPNEARGNRVTAREILDKASKEIATGLSRDTEVQSDLMQTMARTYVNLGLFSLAHGLANSALENRRRMLGPENPKTLQSMTQLGWILDREGRDNEAEKLTRQALQIEKRVLGSEDPLTLESMDNLAVILEKEGGYQEEEALQRNLVVIRSRRLGPENPSTLRSMSNLAGAVSLLGRTAEAEQMYRNTLEIEQRVLGREHPQTIATTHNLANLVQDHGRYAEAEKLYREALALEKQVLGSDHPDTADTMVTLANTLAYGEGHPAEAEALYRKSLEIQQRTVGPEHPYTIRALEGLANVLSTQGHYPDAEKIHRQILSVRQRTLGPEHTDVLLSKYNLAEVLFREGRSLEAERLFRETLEAQIRVLGPENPDTLASRASLARLLISEGHYREAESMARQALEIQLRVLGPQHADSLNTLQYLGMALAYGHHYDAAKKLFTDTINKLSRAQESTVPLAWYNFACVAAAANDRDDAVKYLRAAIDSGYKDADHLRVDDDLKSLRNDRRFQALEANASKPAPAAAQER
jgi:serine/threonine protein kinase/tetratricopeptide (TPR) repeat protein